ncbi:MAG: CHAT domain-containing protein, partial [Bacteroidota bacterium]
DKVGEATALSNIGLIHSEGSDYQQSLKYQLEAFRVRSQIGDQRGLADSYYFLSFALPPMLKGRAFMFSYLTRSLEVSTAIGYAWGREVAARSLLLLFREHPELAPQLDSFQDSVLSLSGEGKLYGVWAKAFRHLRHQRWNEAVHAYEHLLALCDSMGYRNSTPLYLLDQARAMRALGRTVDAEKALLKARRRTTLEQRLRWHGDIDIDLARLYLDSGRRGKGRGILQPLAELLDSVFLKSVRGDDPDLGFRFAAGSVHRHRARVYGLLVEALSDKPVEVFAAMERERALPFWGAAPEEQGGRTESPYADVIRELEAFVDRPDLFESIQKLQAEVGEAIQSMLNDQRSLSSIGWSIQGNRVVALAEVQRCLSDNEVFLEYVVAESVAYVAAVRRDVAVVTRLNASTQRINGAVEILRAALLRGKDNPQDSLWRPSAHRLYQDLIAPLVDLKLVRDGDRLLIAPHGTLHLVPFHCLVPNAPDSQPTFLIEQHTIEYVPSGTALAEWRQKPPR